MAMQETEGKCDLQQRRPAETIRKRKAGTAFKTAGWYEKAAQSVAIRRGGPVAREAALAEESPPGQRVR